MKLTHLLAITVLLLTVTVLPAGAQDTITVFAAASTTNAMTDIAKLYETDHPIRIKFSFASSSTLAKQIEQGAPADLFISANAKWMNYLEEKNAIVQESRKDLLGNRIVFIAPMDSAITALDIVTGMDLAGVLDGGRLSMGDPDHVPAGMYGRKAMETLGCWDGIKDKIARAKDVRAALVMVERGECPLGEVYATDAAISQKVKVVGIFPEHSHPPIVYPVALVKQGAVAQDFLDFLTTDQVRLTFKKYGFSVR